VGLVTGLTAEQSSNPGSTLVRNKRFFFSSKSHGPADRTVETPNSGGYRGASPPGKKMEGSWIWPLTFM